MERNFIPPATEVVYSWLIEDQRGRQLQTAPISFTVLDNRFQWRSLEAGGIAVYAYDRETSVMRGVLEAAQDGLARIASETGMAPAGPLRLALYSSNQDMASSLQRNATHIDFAGIQLSEHVAVLDNTRPHSVVHELAHLVLRQYVGAQFRYQTIPAWINEGLAENLSRPPGAPPLSLVLKPNAPPLRHQATLPRAESRALFYDQSWAVVKFLIDGTETTGSSFFLSAFVKERVLKMPCSAFMASQ